MGFHTFTAATLTSSDVNTYLMNQAVITCTSGLRPPIPPLGMVIYQTDTDEYYYCSNATGPVWSLMTTRMKVDTSAAGATLTDTTFIKDGGPGDVVFTSPGTSVAFRVRYVCRAYTDTSSTGMDLRIYDGGTSSPTTADTIVAASSIWLTNPLTSGTVATVCEGVGTFTAGTHTIAAFYGRTAGSGNVAVSTATGGTRQLTVEMLT